MSALDPADPGDPTGHGDPTDPGGPADPGELAHRRAVARASRHAQPRPCPSCGADLPPRRLFCTEYCRVAVHRIRRTQADLDRLRERHGLARSATERDDLERQIARLEVKRSVRVDRLAARRVAVHGAATCPTAEEGAEGLAEQAG